MQEATESSNQLQMLTGDLARTTLEAMLPHLPKKQGFLSGWFNRKRSSVLEALDQLEQGQGLKAAELIEEQARKWRQDALKSESTRERKLSPEWAFLTTGIVYCLEKTYQEGFNPRGQFQQGNISRAIFLHQNWQSMGLAPVSDDIKDYVLLRKLTVLTKELISKKGEKLLCRRI